MIAVVGVAALPAAAFAIPSISGADGVAINPSNQSPDFTISSPDPGLFWQVRDGADTMVDFGFGGSVDVDTSLPEGGYTLVAFDADGQTPRSFTIDTTPPTGGSLSAPGLTNSADIAVTATGNGEAYALVQGGAPPGPGAYGALPTAFQLAGADGTKQLTLWARDGAGNAAPIATASVVLDRGAPAIAIDTPDDGATYPLGSVRFASYSCDDAFDANPSCAGPVANGAPIDTGTVGTRTFTVTATDAAGNQTSKTVTYHVEDATNPTVSIVTPKAQKYEVNTLVVADFSCADNGSVISCAGTVPKDNPVDTSTLGGHTFTVAATDDSGNTASKTVVYEVVDTRAPQPAGLVSPPDNTVTNQLRPRLNWTEATDPGDEGPGSGIAAYEVILDGDVVATVGPDVTGWTPGEDLDTGQHLWRVRALDKAGNAKLSEVFNFKVDSNATPAPVIVSAPPAATNDNTPSFSWTGAIGAQEYRWALRQGTATLDDGTVSGNSPSIELGALKDGNYVFTVTQRTNGNHGTAAAHAFTVDTVAPGALALVVRPAAVSDDATPLFAWAGGEANARYLWQLSGPGGVIVQGPNETTLNAALLNVTAGSYVFQVRQMDAAGNPGPLTIPEPFTVVGGPPPPPPPPGGDGTPDEPKTPAPTVKKPTKTVKQAAPTTRNAKAMTPRAGVRIASVRPVLRWKARKGASLYNVQVFRLKGTKLTKVVTAFPRGTSYRVPKGKLAAGFRYVWRVWPFVNQRFPAQPLGVSYFDVKQTAKSLARSRLLAPTGTRVPAGKAMTVRWRAKSGSAAYRVQVLRGAKVAFELVSAERTAVVPASVLAAKGTIRLRIMSGVGASDTAFAKAAWAQADLKVR